MGNSQGRKESLAEKARAQNGESMVPCRRHAKGRPSRRQSCADAPTPPQASPTESTPTSTPHSNAKNRTGPARIHRAQGPPKLPPGESPPCIFHHSIGSFRRKHSISTAIPEAPQQVESGIVCAFLRKGICRYGSACRHSHELESQLQKLSVSAEVDNIPKSKAKAAPSDTTGATGAFYISTSTRNSKVTRTSAVVTGYAPLTATPTLSTDPSAVCLINIAPNKSTEDVGALLDSLGVPCIDGSTLDLSPSVGTATQAASQVAKIRADDPDFAQKFMRLTGAALTFDGRALVVKPAPVEDCALSSYNDPQPIAVSCTWPNPTKVAYLHYVHQAEAKEAAAMIDDGSTPPLHGRKMSVVRQYPGRSTIGQQTQVVEVANIDSQTAITDMRHLLRHLQPRYVDFGADPRCPSAQEVQDWVKSALKEKGQLSDWILGEKGDGNWARAYATFQSADAAMKAVKDLHGARLDTGGGALSNDHLGVTLMYHVKLSVYSQVLNALGIKIYDFISQAWKTTQVALRMCDSLDGQHTPIHIYVGSKEKAADTKLALERLLEGHIAVDANDGENPVRHEFFFDLRSDGLLGEFMAATGVQIYRDMHANVLRLYGDDVRVGDVEAALVQKAEFLGEE